VKLTEVLSQYVSYMLTAKKATLHELADFFSLASRLLLRKVRSLFPGAEGEAGDAELLCDEDGVSPDGEMDEERLRVLLERFKPYRAAALKLSELKNERERSFVRVSDEGGPPWFDIGDLYGLSTHWWSLIEERSRHNREARTDFLSEIPDAVPEEILVEQRMAEVVKRLDGINDTSLRELLGAFGSGELVVTLLALLELSRLGRIALSQSGVWGDVRIVAA
jgi:segregation and condensation protein A